VASPYGSEEASALVQHAADLRTQVDRQKFRKIQEQQRPEEEQEQQKAQRPLVRDTLDIRRRKIAIMDDILAYISERGRIVYGGWALNELIRGKDPKDVIYKDTDDVPDVEFYTPDPVRDVVTLCLRLQRQGYGKVLGMEAHHFETYTVSVEGWRCCDISYMPKWIYSSLPTLSPTHAQPTSAPDVATLRRHRLDLVHPHVMLIDYMRILTDPMLSYWRLEKSFSRLVLLLKHFPLEDSWSPSSSPTPNDIDRSQRVYELVARFVNGRTSVVVVGDTAVAYYATVTARVVQNHKGRQTHSRTKPTDTYAKPSVLDVVSTNFAVDASDLHRVLIQVYHQEHEAQISYVEYNAFFDFIGRLGEFIGKDGTVLARIIDNNHKCIPFQSVSDIVKAGSNTRPLPPAQPATSTGVGTNVAASTASTASTAIKAVNLQMGTFSLTVMYLMMFRLRARVTKDGSVGGGRGGDGYEDGYVGGRKKKGNKKKGRTYHLDDRDGPPPPILLPREMHYQRSAKEGELYDLVVHMFSLRDTYLRETSSTILSPTPFKEFVTACTGPVIPALDVKTNIVGPFKAEKFKQMRPFYFDPSRLVLRNEHEVERFVTRFKFLNRAGRVVNNPADLMYLPPTSTT